MSRIGTYLRIGRPLAPRGEKTLSIPMPNRSICAWKVSTTSLGHMQNDNGVDGSRVVIDGSPLKFASSLRASLAIFLTSGFPGLKGKTDG